MDRNLEDAILEVLRKHGELTWGRIEKAVERITGKRCTYEEMASALDSLQDRGLIRIRTKKYHSPTYRIAK